LLAITGISFLISPHHLSGQTGINSGNLLGGNKSGNTLSVYDVRKPGLIRTIELGENTHPHGLDWIHGTSKILVTTEGSQTLLVADVNQAVILQALDTEREILHMVAATPDGRRAFVSSIRSGNVTVFSLPKGERLAQLFTPAFQINDGAHNFP